MTSPFASAAPDLQSLGFSVVPLIPHDYAPHQGRGKCPGEYRSGGWQGMSKWQRFRDSTPSAFELGLWSKAPGANIGLMMGTVARKDLHVVSLDFDAKDPDALDTLLRSAPASPMVKRGQKGETRFYLAPKTLKSKPYDGPDGRLLDLLTGFDCRQTVIPPSIHPDTGLPYVWLAGPVRADELPVLTEDDMSALEEALEQCGWSRERKASPGRDRPARSMGNHIDPDDIWSETKAAALANLDKWVPALDLYGCRPARGGYEAVATWRASSTGRPIPERKHNLSIQRDGIKDFGTNDTYSAIDLVMAARDCDQAAATDWLRERLGLKDEGVVIALGAQLVSADTSQNACAGGQPNPVVPAETSQSRCSDHDLPEPLRPKPVLNATMAEQGIASLQAYALKSEPINVTPAGPANSTGPATDLPDHLTRVPGLVGDITNWIADSARKPQRAGALLAAVELVGTAAGRKFAGPTLTGTHIYGLFLAPSGAAKDHPLKCIGRVLHACTMGAHFGPSGFMSMSALINRITRQPLTLTCIDEFGSFLGRINGRKASTHEKAITGVLRTAWGSSFDTMAPPEWAGRVGEPIHSPALSIYGVSTHEEFFQNLEGGDVFNGFLNRFLILSTHTRVQEREPTADKMAVPASVVDGMLAIYTTGNPLTRATSHNAMADAPMLVVPWADKFAAGAYAALCEQIERMEADAVFFTRTAEMAQRLAVIRAIGCNPAAPRVSLEDMEWGRDVAMWSARETLEMARDYMVETQHQGEAQRVMRCCKRQTWTSYRDIARALNNRMRAKDLREMLDGLVDAGALEMEQQQPPAGGHKVKLYRVPASAS